MNLIIFFVYVKVNVWKEECGEFTFAAGVIFAGARLTGVIGEDAVDQKIGSLFELIDDSVVQGILVLLQPAGDVVRHLQVKRARFFIYIYFL